MSQKRSDMDGVDAYNVVADTVTGLNIHGKDYVVQLIACALGAVLGGVPGLIAGGVIGLFAGAVAGIIAGTFLSGIYIMIYRAVAHAKGKHKQPSMKRKGLLTKET